MSAACRLLEFEAAQAAGNEFEAEGLSALTETSLTDDTLFYDLMRTMPMIAHFWLIVHATHRHIVHPQRAVIAARCVAASHELFDIAL